MGPKKEKKPSRKGDEALDEADAEEQVIEKNEIDMPIDPYENLRYTTPTVIPQRTVAPKAKAKLKKVPVLRKRRDSFKVFQNVPSITLAPQKNVSDAPAHALEKSAIWGSKTTTSTMMHRGGEKWVHNYMVLDARASIPQPLSQWVSPGEIPTGKLKPVMLSRRPASGGAIRKIMEESLYKETHSLARFDQRQHEQYRLEKYLMKRLNKPRNQLLIRRQQIIPQTDGCGYEKTVIKLQNAESPPPEKLPVLSFFNYGKQKNERNGLHATMTRSERGHSVITEWFGAPHLTDFIIKELGLAPTNDAMVKSLEEQQQGCDEKTAQKKEYVPLFPVLAVVSTAHTEGKDKSRRRSFQRRDSGDCSLIGGHTSRRFGAGKSPMGNAPPVESNRDTLMTEMASAKKSEDRTVSGVVLNFGGNILSWYPAENTAARSKVSYIVEIGCTADFGQSAVSSTTMTNMGTVAITYNWMKVNKENSFKLPSKTHVRFAFDYWGGVILPGETHRVPCLFKASDSGYFSEDWRLLTKPVLECGAHVTLRLWGITRQTDASRRSIEAIENHLKGLITRTIAHHRVRKIIDNLPLKEIPLRDTRFPLVHLGPDLFHLKNPNLKYSSPSVYRLSKLLELFDTQLAWRTKPVTPSTVQIEGVLLPHEHVDMDPRAGNARSPPGTERAMTASNSFSDVQSKRLSNMYSYAEEEDEIEDEQSEISDTLYAETIEDAYDDDLGLDRLTGTFIENVAHLQRALLKKTNIDNRMISIHPNAKKGGKSKGNFETSDHLTEDIGTPSLPHPYVNIVDPNYAVDSLRSKILANPRLEVQEAAFEILYDEVTKLSFRPFETTENWKVTVGRTYLCNAIDVFAEYALRLKRTCCISQLEEQRAVRREQERAARAEQLKHLVEDEISVTSDGAASVIEEEVQNANNSMINEADTAPANERESTATLQNSTPGGKRLSMDKNSLPHNISEKLASNSEEHEGNDNTVVEIPAVAGYADDDTSSERFLYSCMRINPREIFTLPRFQDQYYNRLHTCMYELLSDFVDQMDLLWVAPELPKKLNQFEDGITRVRNISRGVDIKSYLESPLPPRWIRVAQKMDSIAAQNKARVESNKLRSTSTALVM